MADAKIEKCKKRLLDMLLIAEGGDTKKAANYNHYKVLFGAMDDNEFKAFLKEGVMRVKELIELLKRCNQDDIVLYDMENSLKNESYVTRNDNGENFIETIMGIDDVLIGSGTRKGSVYLVEKKYEIQK